MSSSTARPNTTVDPCGPATGIRITGTSASMARAARDAFTERTRATWSAGAFGRIAQGYAAGAAAFVDRLELAPGEIVLDAACGTGALAIPAARTGASVRGIDIAPNLVQEARDAAGAAELPIQVEEGDVEAMPYADACFTTVMSMFGVVFAPHQERAMAEVFRVTRPGGRIALANWTPRGFVGSMLRAHAALVPPPPGLPSVLAWGDETALTMLLAPHRERISAVSMVPRDITLAFPTSPAGTVEFFREFYGPSLRTYAVLHAEGRASLSSELVQLWASRNTAGDGATSVESEYLDVRIDLA